LISDALWEIITPLLPPEPHKPTGGRPRTISDHLGSSRIISDRAALTGIVFVLKSGIPWEMLPQELGCGSGMTCLHRMLLQRLQDTGRIDWTRASLDSASAPALVGQSDREGSNKSRQVGDQAPHRR
jgi:transposase